LKRRVAAPESIAASALASQKIFQYQCINRKQLICVADHIPQRKPGLDYNHNHQPGMERAMSTTTMTSFPTYRRSHWGQFKSRVAEWHRRSRSRDELQGFSDADLRDIGISRCDVHHEIHKPFWMA